MNWRNYFRDSYGFDNFSRFLLIAGAILSFGRYVGFIGYAVIIYAICRAVSKNKYKRQQELLVFQNYLLILKQKYYRHKVSFAERKQFKIFKCPNCSQKLRVPRNKGRIVVTCKKCGTEFRGKS